ncbi:MAG: hypothetical protein H7195_07685, partial [Chryseobacterium sp.]|nr:hypothetical protein [Chryseobacterium sp.]
KLVEKIFLTRNVNLLDAIDKIFTSTETTFDNKFQLSSHQKEMLFLAEEDIKYGRVISDIDLRKIDEEWMK